MIHTSYHLAGAEKQNEQDPMSVESRTSVLKAEGDCKDAWDCFTGGAVVANGQKGRRPKHGHT